MLIQPTPATQSAPEPAPGHAKQAPVVVAVPGDDTLDTVPASQRDAHDHLEATYQQAREQAHGWHRASLAAATAGLGLFFLGAVLAIAGHTAAGISSIVVAGLQKLAAALFFAQSKKANQRVDAMLKQLVAARGQEEALRIAETIRDIRLQDELKALIVKTAIEPMK